MVLFIIRQEHGQDDFEYYSKIDYSRTLLQNERISQKSKEQIFIDKFQISALHISLVFI